MRPPSRPRVRGGQDDAAPREPGTRAPRRGPAAAWDDAPGGAEVVEAELVEDEDEAWDVEVLEDDAAGTADEVTEAAGEAGAGAPGPSREVVAVDPRDARSARLRATLASSRRAAHGGRPVPAGVRAAMVPGADGSAGAAGTEGVVGPAGAVGPGGAEGTGGVGDGGAATGEPAPSSPAGDGASSVVSAGLAARLAEREAFERRRRLKRGGVVLAGLAAVGALGWAIFLSPLFALDPQQITVEGASEYVNIGEVAGIAGQEGGTPLPRLSTGDLAARISTLPGVGGAVVLRDWPHGLSIEVHPRVPVATAQDPDGVALVDGSGVVVAVVKDAPEGLPELTVPLVPAQATTTAARDARETVAAVLEVLRVLPDSLRAQVATAGGSSPATVTLTLHGGATVQWGSAADAELKAAVLEVLVEQQPARDYDVSVPDRPTTS